MVSGAKKSNKTQKKGKQKLVLAKDPKQLAIAALVIVLFIANSIYMVVKYVQEQNPPPLTAAQQAQMQNMTPEKMIEMQKSGQAPGSPSQVNADGQATSAQPGGNTSTQSPQQVQNTQAPPPTADSGMNPLIPIIIILLIAGLGYFLYQSSQNNSGSLPSKKGKAKGKGKEKFMLAKDPKQLAIALVVILIFAANSIYMAVKYIQEQNPPPPTAAELEQADKTMMKMKSESQVPGAPSQGEPSSASTQPIDNTTAQSPQQLQTPPPTAPSSGIIPLIISITALLAVAAAYLIYNYSKNNTASLPTPATYNPDEGEEEEEEKTGIAKNPKQLTIAAIVILIFLANGIFMLVKYLQEQNPSAQIAKDPSGPQSMAEKIAQRQQQNLQSLENGGANPNANIAQDANDIYSQTVNLQGGNPTAQTPGETNAGGQIKTVNSGGAESDVEIIPKRMVRQANGKMVMIAVDNSGRSNPFLPASENYVPSASSLPFLPPPPETLQSDSEAAKVMTTVISGILYDKYSPSAIINIEGTDYLVKRGDVVNRYKVLSISKTQVLVQLGKNVYQAGVGELLSLTNLNFNTIANLNKKFGGNDVSINVKKKGY